MALSNEERTTLLDELERAYYSGVLTINFNGNQMTYRSTADIGNAIDKLKGTIIDPVTGTAPTKRRSFSLGSFRKGY